MGGYVSGRGGREVEGGVGGGREGGKLGRLRLEGGGRDWEEESQLEDHAIHLLFTANRWEAM